MIAGGQFYCMKGTGCWFDGRSGLGDADEGNSADGVKRWFYRFFPPEYNQSHGALCWLQIPRAI